MGLMSHIKGRKFVLAAFVFCWLGQNVLFAKAKLSSKKTESYIKLVHVGRASPITFLLPTHWVQNRSVPKNIQQGVNDFLRCHHTEKTRKISPQLLHRLVQIAKHFNAKQIDVIAGYRSRDIARAKGTKDSQHARGAAIDIRIPGVTPKRLATYVQSHYTTGGVGHYPKSGFTHIDVRPSPLATWVDKSGPGEQPKYVAWSRASAKRTSKRA